MTPTVYTNYWISRIGDVRKEHGSYKTEEEVIEGVKVWWELHKEISCKNKQVRIQVKVINNEDHFHEDIVGFV